MSRVQASRRACALPGPTNEHYSYSQKPPFQRPCTRKNAARTYQNIARLSIVFGKQNADPSERIGVELLSIQENDEVLEREIDEVIILEPDLRLIERKPFPDQMIDLLIRNHTDAP